MRCPSPSKVLKWSLLALAAASLSATVWLTPAVRAAEPALALAAAFRGGASTDPWGEPYFLANSGWREDICSAGPNGVPEAGRGDDIFIQQALRWPPYATDLLLWSTELFVGLALLLAWLALAPSCAKAPRCERLSLETARAGLLALGPAVVCVAAVRLDVTTKDVGVTPFQPARTPLTTILDPDGLLLVPPAVALAGSLVLVAVLVALGWRLRSAGGGQGVQVPDLGEHLPARGQPAT